MQALLIKTQEVPSKFGGTFYYAFFKNKKGSFRSCLYPAYRNFSNWKPFIGRENITLTGLKTIGKMVDADSRPKEKILQESKCV